METKQSTRAIKKRKIAFEGSEDQTLKLFSYVKVGNQV